MTLILFPPFTWEHFLQPRSLMAGGLQTPEHAPTTKPCPFSPQVKAKLRNRQKKGELLEASTAITKQGRFPSMHRNPGWLLCSLSCCSPTIPIHKRHEWWERKKMHLIVHATALSAGLFPLLSSPLSYCNWGVSDVCTSTESARKQRASVHDLSLMVIPRTNHSPCLLPLSHQDLMQRWIPSVSSILPPLADTSGHLWCRKLVTLQQFATSKSKMNQTQISITDTLYEADTRFYSLSRYQKH